MPETSGPAPHLLPNCIDVTSPRYGADPSGVRDSSVAILFAVADLLNVPRGDAPIDLFTPTGLRFPNLPGPVHRTLYFPAGTYRTNWGINLGLSQVTGMKLHVRGAGRDRTVIKLNPGAMGFDDPSQPHSLMSFLSASWSNIAFMNTIEDISLHVGANNPGAIGLLFHNNNVGCIRRVRITADPGSGHIGLRLGTRLSGVGLVKDVEIRGFAIGINNDDRFIHPGYTLEHIRLSEQRMTGMRSVGKALSIRRLASENSVPAITQDGPGGTVFICDSELRSPGSAAAAIENSDGWLVARNVRSTGYGATLHDGTEHPAIPSDAFYATGGALRLWPALAAGSTVAPLPITETPEIPWDAPDQWVVVAGHDATAIQTAIDSGAATVILGHRTYSLDHPIILRKTLRRLHANWARLEADPTAPKQPWFIVEGDATDSAVVLEAVDAAFAINGPAGRDPQSGPALIQHPGSRTLILADLFLPQGPSYHGTGDGNLYIENVCSGGGCPVEQFSKLPGWIIAPGQRAWARSLNHEGSWPHIVNHGKLWVLGAKFGEEHGPYLDARPGSQTEIMVAVLNSLAPRAEKEAAVHIHNATVKLSLLERARDRANIHPVVVQETCGDESRQLAPSGTPTRPAPAGHGFALPLYENG